MPHHLRINRGRRRGPPASAFPRHHPLTSASTANAGVPVPSGFEPSFRMPIHEVANFMIGPFLLLRPREGAVPAIAPLVPHGGLSEDVIERSLKIRQRDGEAPPSGEEVVCVVCQDDLSSQKVGVLRCGHEFHADCIKQWLLQKNICPLCKVAAL